MLQIGRDRPKRSGFTLVELLVTISILGVLFSIALVAVNAARGQARRITCSNRLAQIGMAALNFEASDQHFPSGRWQDEIISFMGAQGLETQMSKGIVPKDFSLFLCPSDSGNSFEESDRLYGNYQFCFGTWPGENSSGVIGNYNNPEVKPVRVSDIRDGLSQTALASESLRSGHQNSGKNSRLRALWITPGPPYMPHERDLFASACANIPSDPFAVGWRGNFHAKSQIFVKVEPGDYFISVTAVGANLYNHILPPQSPSCLNGGVFYSAIASASGNHSGVVEVVYCDGHVSSVGSRIELIAWRNQGTKNDSKDVE